MMRNRSVAFSESIASQRLGPAAPQSFDGLTRASISPALTPGMSDNQPSGNRRPGLLLVQSGPALMKSMNARTEAARPDAENYFRRAPRPVLPADDFDRGGRLIRKSLSGAELKRRLLTRSSAGTAAALLRCHSSSPPMLAAPSPPLLWPGRQAPSPGPPGGQGLDG